MSTTSRGNYYKNKTRDWYRKQGYQVEITEFVQTLHFGGRKVFNKRDVFGSDGISMNDKEIIFWNSKGATTEKSAKDMIRHAKKEFSKFVFPPCVRVHIFVWRARQKPEIIVFQ